jgi:hypothetical protein
MRDEGFLRNKMVLEDCDDIFFCLVLFGGGVRVNEERDEDEKQRDIKTMRDISSMF